jgi:AcrR family transcriptional regulator
MVYRRTHQVVKRLAARRSAILAAARDAAAEGGMAAVQIAPVAARANVAAGTVYRYFPSKADLISELIADVSRAELIAIRRAADAAPGPSSALAAAVTTVAVHAGVGHSRRAGRCRRHRIAPRQPPRDRRRDRGPHRGGRSRRTSAGAGYGARRHRPDRRAA